MNLIAFIYPIVAIIIPLFTITFMGGETPSSDKITSPISFLPKLALRKRTSLKNKGIITIRNPKEGKEITEISLIAIEKDQTQDEKLDALQKNKIDAITK